MREVPRHWQPLVEVRTGEFHHLAREIVAECAKHYNLSDDEARAFLDNYYSRCKYYVNDLYQVEAEAYAPGCLHLNIRRRDGGMFKDWRHFQQIKNEIAGPEREAVEVYPAESRKVDTTNKWHLWVQPEGVRINVGWPERDVSYDERRDVPGLRQRPL